jgi:hypothetical protein
MGIAVVMGILWRRMNSSGVFAATLVGALLIIGTRYVVDWPATSLKERGAITVTAVPADQADSLRKEGKLVVGHEFVEWQDSSLPRTLHRMGLLQWSGTEMKSLALTFTLMAKIGLPLLGGILAGILGSLVTPRPKQEALDKFFRKIYVPIGQEGKLDRPLDEVVPRGRRWCTWGGLFLLKPSRQTWVGFVLLWAICLGLVGLMALLLS